METDAATVAANEPPWCDDCHAHIIPMPWWERALSWVCWFLVMHWPHRFFVSKVHMAVLPWAGNIAYRCSCRKGRLAVRRELEGGDNG